MHAERLTLTVGLQPHETSTGYASRLAHRNGVSLATFLQHMAIPVAGLRDGADSAIREVAVLGGVDLARLTRAAFIRASQGEGPAQAWTVRGQRLLRPTINRTRVRICPQCITDDVAIRSDAGPHAHHRAWQRIAWQVEAIRACPTHGVILAELETDGFAESSDFTAVISRHLGSLPELAATASPSGPSRGDTYLVARLEGCSGPAWLDGLAFHVAARAIEIVGAASLKGRRPGIKAFTDLDWIAACDRGYEILSVGEEGFRVFLDTLLETFDWRTATGSAKAQAVYGFIHEWLSRGARHPDFEPIKRVFREHILAHLPIAGGDDVCGEILDRRRLHTISSAASAHGLHPTTTRKILLAAGLIGSDAAPGHVHRQVMDADAASRLLEGFSTSLPLPEALERLSINRTLGSALVKGGHLRPVVPTGKGVTPTYAIADVDDLRDRLLSGSEPIPHEPTGCETLATALRRLNCTWRELVDLILERRIWRGLLDRNPTIEGLVIRLDEAAKFVRAGEVEGLRFFEAAKLLVTTPVAVAMLVENGHLPINVRINPLNRCPMNVIPHDAAIAFRNAKVGAWEVSRIAALPVNTVTKTLAKAGISPTIPKSEGKSPWFERDAVNRWLLVR